jgi:hypothetical protein
MVRTNIGFVGVGEVDAMIEEVIDVETGNNIIYVGGIGRLDLEWVPERLWYYLGIPSPRLAIVGHTSFIKWWREMCVDGQRGQPIGSFEVLTGIYCAPLGSF